MDLIGKVQDRTARVGIIGLGYAGLPLALEFGRQGFSVSGFDVDAEKVDALNSGSSYIHHVSSSTIKSLVEGGRFRAYQDFSCLASQAAILICVPTPLTEMREPDLKYVEETAKQVAERLRLGQLVVLESTTYPGTTEEVVLPILEGSGLNARPKGKELFRIVWWPIPRSVWIPRPIGRDGSEAHNLHLRALPAPKPTCHRLPTARHDGRAS